MKFYVVKKGSIPGIYRSWDQCLEVVKGYAGAIYKSFTYFPLYVFFVMSDVHLQSANMKVDLNIFGKNS